MIDSFSLTKNFAFIKKSRKIKRRDYILILNKNISEKKKAVK